MHDADLDDDVYGEDPTVNALQEKAAELWATSRPLCAQWDAGQPDRAPCLVPGRNEVICGEKSHTLNSEQANAARVAQIQLRTVPQDRASLDIDAMGRTIRGDDPHFPRTGLLWVEQPCNGWAMPLDELAAISKLAKSHNLPLHMDGARVFNAAIALVSQPPRLPSTRTR